MKPDNKDEDRWSLCFSAGFWCASGIAVWYLLIYIFLWK